MEPTAIPLTVIGGYLGAGKTTLLNRLLADPGGRRLGVVVNDFGELSIDVARLATAGGDGVVSLPNGCVCCTLGADLQQTLTAMTAVADPPDQVVIEVSGVADPSVTAAWGTVPPFAPGGVIVLAAADTVRRQADDRYVGAEVRRQLAGADLVVVTKTDLVDDPAPVIAWCSTISGGATVLPAVHGRLDSETDDVASDVVLGLRPGAVAAAPVGVSAHDARYARWAWSSDRVFDATVVRAALAEPAAGVLRLKGWLRTDAGPLAVDVVGRRVDVRPSDADPPDSRLVAIGLADQLAPNPLEALLPSR